MMMRPSLLLLFCLCLATAVSAAVDPSFLDKRAAHGRQGPDFPAGPVCDATERAARPASTSLVLGEPLVIEIQLKGASLGEPQPFAFSARLGKDIRVYVTPENRRLGSTAEIAPNKTAPLASQSTLTLQRDQKFQFLVVCAHDPNTRSGAPFDQPGRYIVNVRMNCPKKDPMTGNHWEDLGAFVVEVHAPGEADDDKIAWDALKPFDVYSAVQNQIVGKREHLKVLEDIVARAPKSKIRPYALMALARTAYADFNVDSTQLDRCVKFLRILVEEHPDYVYASQASEFLVRTLIAQEHYDEARTEFIDRIWEDPDAARDVLPGHPLMLTYVGEQPPPVTGQWMVFNQPSDAMVPERSESSEILRQALGDEMADRLGEPVMVESH